MDSDCSHADLRHTDETPTYGLLKLKNPESAEYIAKHIARYIVLINTICRPGASIKAAVGVQHFPALAGC